MAFPQSVIDAAWKRSGGYCECERKTHDKPCGKRLAYKNRGREGQGKWEGHHKWAGGPDTLSNCEILCWDCHKATF